MFGQQSNHSHIGASTAKIINQKLKFSKLIFFPLSSDSYKGTSTRGKSCDSRNFIPRPSGQ